VQRALNSHGRGAAGVADWSAAGILTRFDSAGKKLSAPFTIQQKGMTHIQRMFPNGSDQVREGTDGSRTWQSFHNGRTVVPATGATLQFIESQTIRSIQRLFNFQGFGLTLNDKGKNGKSQAIEAIDSQGRSTTYFIDDSTSLIFSWSSHRYGHRCGQPEARHDTRYVRLLRFSEHSGNSDSFQIERYQSGMKLEEFNFTSLQYNASIPDTAFQP
jgi:hypothetical protein